MANNKILMIIALWLGYTAGACAAIPQSHDAIIGQIVAVVNDDVITRHIGKTAA
jgi:hypothetical protein